MFLKTQTLKKLMKSAYKVHLLTVGNTGEEYYLRGINWELICRKEFVPNSILAQVIELAGELPAIGECFRTDVDGNQMAVFITGVNIPKKAEKITETDILIESNSGEYQRALWLEEKRKVYLINEAMYQMVDPECCDYDHGETSPEGPFCDPDAGIFYKNNTMTVRLLFRVDEKHEQLLERLEKIYLI